MTLLLGLDVGTTSVKAGLFDAAGRQLAADGREYQLAHPSPDHVEIDAATWWTAAVAAVRAVLASPGVDPRDVAGMAVSSQGETVVAVDAAGQPLGPALVWLDNRAAAEARELAQRARDRKLKPEEYTGSTFSVSNLGMFGIDQFTAIINPPEVGIVAVGAVEEKPVVVDGAVVVRPRMRLTMSCDHRVVDGATGARFLQTLRRMLENPLMLAY
jgi:hypothetical protein